MATQKIAIEFSITEVSNKCLRQISETLKVIGSINNLLLNYTEQEFSPIEIDSLPIYIENPQELTISKEKILLWLFKKAFEQFISGLTDSLIEAYKFYEILSLSKDSEANSIYSYQEVQNRLAKINDDAHKFHFPILIEKIEQHINNTLLFKKEILSINKVRACLVHRNGIVTKYDTNSLYSLDLHYIDRVVLVEKDGEIIRLTKELKSIPFITNNIIIQNVAKCQKNMLNTSILINGDLFNGVANTCILFVEHLYSLLPIDPNNIVEKEEFKPAKE